MEGSELKKLIIVGASGHGKVIADIALKNGYEEIVFLDDDESLNECAGFPVVGRTSEAERMDGDKIVAIGNAKIRARIQGKIDNVVSLIHPEAVISRRVEIGEGTVIMAGAIINSDTVIAEGCIINTGSSVDHDCRIGSFSHIAVGAHVAGNVKIGEFTWIGAGATVSNNICVCGECIIGAGSVVIKNIENAGTYVGVPAKKIKKQNKNSKSGGAKSNLRQYRAYMWKHSGKRRAS